MLNADPPAEPLKRPSVAISTNPRRTHPSQSKSLPRHKKVKLDHHSDGLEEIQGPSEGQRSMNLLHREGSSSDQSASKWFNRANRNVETSQDKDKHGEESPFFMAQQKSYNPPGNPNSVNAESYNPYLPRDENENDELRGVIDDLTVENKKLKGLLRHWQSHSSPSSTNPDKILEVRVHGLPAEKKRELEHLLKNFTTNLSGTSPSQPSPYTSGENSALTADNPLVTRQKQPHGQTNTDSGYASVTNSGLPSTSLSGRIALRDTLPKRKRDKDIKDYLHDIPDSLFPREPLTVSENTKMSLVVERLEQLFTGKRAVPGEHSLPLQQQKISRSAAKADRRENQRLNRAAKTEGSREARILPPDTKINLDALDQTDLITQRLGVQSESDNSPTENTEKTARPPKSPDQRPTRPLDLDIHRAQVASENVEYLRHLGLSSSNFEDDTEQGEQQWIYMNLLVSMAQLHTLNVTPAFVRKAIKQLSTKFELSKDGHKIRWKGGTDSPRFANAQQSPAFGTMRLLDDAGDDGGRKSGRSATTSLNDRASASLSDDKVMRGVSSTTTSHLMNSASASSNNQTGGQPSATTHSQSKSSAFDYKPIVYQGKKNFLKANHSYLDSSCSSSDHSPESGGVTHAMSRSSIKSKDPSHEGLLTFFSNPYFCADLSGDKSPVNMRSNLYGQPLEVLGMQQPDPERETLRDAATCYYAGIVQPERGTWPDQASDLQMFTRAISDAGEGETQPMEFPSSGIGGVRPEDNFALDVDVARIPRKDVSGKGTTLRKQPRYQYRVVGCRKLDLQPSRLPPPSYVFFTGSSSSSADKGYFYEATNSGTSEEDESPAPAGFLWQWSSSSNERQVDEDDASQASSSLGVLEAARARQPNQGAVPAQDREYIINPAGGTMSGSLAATVGASCSQRSVADQEPGCDLDSSSGSASVDMASY